LDKEEYCIKCEGWRTRGHINCTGPELKYCDGGKPLSLLLGPLNNGQISVDPLTSDNTDVSPEIYPKVAYQLKILRMATT
jgi:hypothetical protein